MFSPYDNANAREESDAMQKLSPEDKSTYEESIQRLRKYINQLLILMASIVAFLCKAPFGNRKTHQ